MEQAIQILIYIHAAFGGLALGSACGALLAKKGKKAHSIFGLIFFYCMSISGGIALLVAVLPKHENPFLFAIGVFSLYFVITGKRALRFKSKSPRLKIDFLISVIMIITGVFMILLPIILQNKIDIVLSVFASVGIGFSVRDLQLYAQPERLQKVWLKLHLGKMIGGFISATTAFVVVNQYLPGLFAWFAPSILGVIIMIYWFRKLNKKATPASPVCK